MRSSQMQEDIKEIYVIPDLELLPLTKSGRPHSNLVKSAWNAVHTVEAQNVLGDYANLAEFRIMYFANKANIELPGISKSESNMYIKKALRDPKEVTVSDKEGHGFFVGPDNHLRYGKLRSKKSE